MPNPGEYILETGRLPTSELAIGLVAPLGVEIESLLTALRDRLQAFSYNYREVRLSNLLDPLVERFSPDTFIDDTTVESRIRTRMDAGNRVRARTRPDILALAALARIDDQRGEDKRPVSRTANIFRTLKNPAEVRTLRTVYGSGFFLIGIFATEEERRGYLVQDKSLLDRDANNLIKRDQGEEDENGQQTRDTYLLADAFIRTKEHLWRVLDLLFGAPYVSPTADEYGMFLAYSASLRSVDLSRQVGAVVMSPEREILSTGCNDVPSPGGGLYWEDDDGDKRDFRLGKDSNAMRRREIIVDVAKRLTGAIGTDDDIYRASKKQLEGSPLLDLTEYGRPVHAEMEALLSAARIGVSVRRASLFTTTYPCHNCAKHIVASGIARVIYVEPYPKSLARDLHGDSIQFLSDGGDTEEGSLRFEPFVGVGPRRFFDLFSLKLGSGYPVKRKMDGAVIDWSSSRNKADLRVPMQPLSYLEREAHAVRILNTLGDKNERNETDPK